MKLFKTSFLIFSAVAAISFARPAKAVDKDDFFVNVYGGARFDGTAQGGVAFGYAPFDSIGFGVLVDGTRSVGQISLEPRWFIEPFEFAGGIGYSRDYSAGNQGNNSFLLSLSFAYLVALTPSIALRGELRGQYLKSGTSSALISIGGRLVF